MSEMDSFLSIFNFFVPLPSHPTCLGGPFVHPQVQSVAVNSVSVNFFHCSSTLTEVSLADILKYYKK